jgi:hypothetical protein
VQRDQGNNKIVMQGQAGQEHLSIVSPRTLNNFVGGVAPKALSAAANGDVIAGDDIPIWLDGNGLASIQSHWATLSGGATAPDSSANANTGSAGAVNTLSLGNNNTWSVGNVNVWTGADVNTYVSGKTYQELHGGSDVIYFEYQVQTILGDNTATTLGDNSVIVVGANQAINIGSNTTINFGYNVTLTLFATDEVFGMKTTSIFGFEAETVTTKLKTIVSDLKTVLTGIETVATHIKTGAVSIFNHALHMHQ